MPYALTLADLAMPGTTVGVCLRLHGCKEVIHSATIGTDERGFLGWIGMGKLAGLTAMHLQGPTSREAMESYLLADAYRDSLDPDDPMYPVATDYDSHQRMREVVKQTLTHIKRQRGHMMEVERTMCALSAWLVLHDPTAADITREQTRASFREHGRALFTIACTKNRAYVRHVGPVHINMDRALRSAEHSTKSGLVFANDLDFEFPRRRPKH